MLSIILPSYNENRNIRRAYDNIKEILEEASIPFELVYVNDGSKDSTWDEICKVVALGKRN